MQATVSGNKSILVNDLMTCLSKKRNLGQDADRWGEASWKLWSALKSSGEEWFVVQETVVRKNTAAFRWAPAVQGHCSRRGPSSQLSAPGQRRAKVGGKCSSLCVTLQMIMVRMQSERDGSTHRNLTICHCSKGLIHMNSPGLCNKCVKKALPSPHFTDAGLVNFLLWR